ncbi:MAG: adventurous gliding motility protein CglE [Myxococcaceae bacterium]
MRQTLLLGVALLGGIVPAVAVAQSQAAGAAPLLEKEAPVDEVERGFYLGADVGLAYLGGLPAAAGTPSPSAWGLVLRLEAGYDIGRYVTVSLFGAFTAYSAGSDYIGFSNGVASGAFTQLIPGLDARFNFLGFADGQGVQRTWLYLKVGVGWAFFQPTALFTPAPSTAGYSALYAFAGVGVQYYTHLRHFSIGLEVDGTYLGKSNELGFMVTPNIRYAF